MAITRMGIRKKRKLVERKARWEDVDVNLLRKVFQLIPAKELLLSVSLVCRQWRSVCWDTLFWKDDETLELSTLKHLVGWPIHHNYSFRMFTALQCMLKWIAKHNHIQGGLQSPRCVRTIIFAHMYVRGVHLNLVAKRSPKLKRLILPDTNRKMELNDVSLAITKWKELEELSLGPIMNARTDHLFQTIGKNCKNFTKLHIFGSLSASVQRDLFTLDDYNASIIVQNMHQLKEFNIDKAIIMKLGVEVLLSESENLEQLNLKLCFGVVNSDAHLIFIMPEFRKDRISANITREIMHGHEPVNNWSIVSESLHGNWPAHELVNHVWAE